MVCMLDGYGKLHRIGNQLQRRRTASAFGAQTIFYAPAARPPEQLPRMDLKKPARGLLIKTPFRMLSLWSSGNFRLPAQAGPNSASQLPGLAPGFPQSAALE